MLSDCTVSGQAAKEKDFASPSVKIKDRGAKQEPYTLTEVTLGSF